jgi:uncharacterized protein (DUF302 family)
MSQVTQAAAVPEIVTKRTSRSVSETVSNFEELLQTRGIKLFAVIDQQAEAQRAGLELRETTLMIFGSPAAGTGTPVMAASPLAALDLPLKVVVWAGDDGETKISYVTPAALAARHRLGPDLAKNLDAV